MPAACTAPEAVCTFQYSDADTPAVTAISPSNVTMGSSPVFISVSGMGFQADTALNQPMVDDEPCLDVALIAPGRLKCRLPYSVKGGSRLVGCPLLGWRQQGVL